MSGHCHQHKQDLLSEADLIERAKLTSSAKELKLRVNCDTNNSASNQSYERLDKITKQEHAIQTESGHDSKEIEEKCLSAEPVQAYEAVLFYETHTDESTLINYSKLADDGLGATDEYSEKLIHGVIGTDDMELDLPQDLIDAVYNGNTDGLRARANSYAPLELLQGITDEAEKVDCFRTSVNSVVRGASSIEVRTQLAEYYQMPIKPPDRVETREDKTAIAVWKTVQADESTVADDVLRDADFCRLVDEVVNELAEYDLDEILSIFAGTSILEMTGLVSPEQMMDELQKYRLVSRDNLHHLHTLIMRLDDTDLYMRAVQYTRHHHDIVYFYQEHDRFPKGFGTVRCFISGCDFTRFSREDLELVRFKVASLLFMPAYFIYIVGIEPGQRVMVTLMLLERYVEELSEMAKGGLPELGLINVDTIQIYGTTYSTTGTTAVEKYRGEGHVAFLSVYQQLREKTKRLEERDDEIGDLRKEAEFMQLELGTKGAELEMLTEKALYASIDKRRFNSQSIDKHSRTLSFPLSSWEYVDDRKFALALESAVVDALEHVSNEDKIKKAQSNRKIARMIDSPSDFTHRHVESGRKREHSGDNHSSDGTVTSTNKMVEKRDELMDEIQAILDEILYVQIKVTSAT